MDLSRNDPSASSGSLLKNYYDVLQVDYNVSRVQVREAFLRLKKTYSSGSQALYSIMDEEEARQSLVEIEEAFRVLDDDTLRREYDARLRASGYFKDFAPTAMSLNVDERSWSDAPQGLAASTDLGDAQVLPRRNPSLYKVSPRLADAAVRERVAKIQEEGAPGDGLLYKHIREAAGVTIKELYSQIKIIPEYIEALESNDYAKLPALVYVKGFLRSYLQFIGVTDWSAAIEAFSERWQEWEAQSKI